MNHANDPAKTIAIYPGTFDPITLGHQDLIKRACRLFNRVLVAIAGGTDKQTMFSIDERIMLAREIYSEDPQVEICHLQGLVTDLARQYKSNVIVRGLRAVSDFDYEIQMATMNRQLYAETETIFLTPAAHLTYLSSSMVREISQLGGDVSQFVHPFVLKALSDRIKR